MRAVIQFDECKPHWATKRGLDKAALALGMTNIKLTGDFDDKITLIYGDVESVSAFSDAIKGSPLSEGSVYAVGGVE